MRTANSILHLPEVIPGHWLRSPFLEAGIWMAGLFLMALPDPSLSSTIDLCLLKAIGLSGCPGCGLGHAMGYLFRGQWGLAVESHWFSPFVLAVLMVRIAGLVRMGFARN